MKKIFKVTGMTCGGCVATVTESLSQLKGIKNVAVNLELEEAQIDFEKKVPLSNLKAVLPQKYTILEEDTKMLNTTNVANKNVPKTKLKQLRPLLLIFAYLLTASILLNYKNWNTQEAMLDFMGLFYIVFSFFKFLDLKGFPESFKMYDPLTKAIPIYGRIYPFIELVLGLLFLIRFQVKPALVITLVILGITTIGVTKTLLDKKSIQCACLGTALKLPMTEATFIENAIMLLMASFMLIS